MDHLAELAMPFCQIFHPYDMTHRGPEALDLEEDVDNAAVAEKGHDPEEEEHDPEKVGDQWIGRGKLEGDV